MRRAFALIELLACLAVFTLLAGLVLAGVQKVRASAARADCQNRLRQLGLAAQNYHAAHRTLPPGVSYPSLKSDRDLDRHAGISWPTLLLPHLEHDALWRKAWQATVDFPSGDTPEHYAVSQVDLAAFRCPTDPRAHGARPHVPGDPGWGLTNYVGVAGTGMRLDDGLLHPGMAVPLTGIADGSSNTILLGERPSGPSGIGNSWYSGWGTLRYFYGQLLPVSVARANQPLPRNACRYDLGVFQAGRYDDPCDQGFFWSLHLGGANFAFADGSVRFLSYSAASVLPALATRSGGEVVGLD